MLAKQSSTSLIAEYWSIVYGLNIGQFLTGSGAWVPNMLSSDSAEQRRAIISSSVFFMANSFC